MTSKTPLVIDLDRSLLRTDTLHELIAAALPRPGVLGGAFWQLITSGRAALKRHLTDHVTVDAGLLPVNEAVLEFIREERASGRELYLATGADARIAEDVTKRFAEFSGYFSSDGQTNFTGSNKAALLVKEFGSRGFDYVGDSRKDLAVWEKSAKSYLVASNGVPAWAKSVKFAAVLREEGRSTWRSWLKELRIHQSLKNLLLFLPVLAAHSFESATMLLLIGGFVAFALMASSVYLLNDLLDLRSDRLHVRKSQRPIAAGRILPLHALAASGLLSAVAIGISILIGVGFAIVLISYAILTCLYSFWLKRVTLVDVTILAMLYMIRILAGAVIAGIELSFWFTGVALFLFISLALAKRYTELARPLSREPGEAVPGRGYSRGDAAVVLPLGLGAGIAVLLLMAIYLQSDAVTLLYPSSNFLWPVIPAMFYWIGNLWIQAGRGTMHDDPIVFALKNPASIVSGLIIAIIFVVASTPVESVIERFLAPLIGG